jgi:hypothetical protein
LYWIYPALELADFASDMKQDQKLGSRKTRTKGKKHEKKSQNVALDFRPTLPFRFFSYLS